jgi:hypothetical protein
MPWHFYYQKGNWAAFEPHANNTLNDAMHQDNQPPYARTCMWRHHWTNPGGKQKHTDYTLDFTTMEQTSGDSGQTRSVRGYWNDGDPQFDWQQYVDAAQFRHQHGLRLLPHACPLSQNEDDHFPIGGHANEAHDVATPLVEATDSQPSAAQGQQDDAPHVEDDKEAGEQANEASDSQGKSSGWSSSYYACGTTTQPTSSTDNSGAELKPTNVDGGSTWDSCD